jgi:adenylate cyclase
MWSVIQGRLIHFTILFVLLMALSIGVSQNNPVRERLAFIWFDSFYKHVERPSPDKVKIIDIDDISLSQPGLGQWPWSRRIVANMVDNLMAMGAVSIAFDGVLAEPDRTSPSNFKNVFLQMGVDEQSAARLIDNDVLLTRAIERSGRFITGFSHGSNQSEPFMQPDPQAPEKGVFQAAQSVEKHFIQRAMRFESTALWLPFFERAAAGNGSFMALPENDGLIRRTKMVFTDGARLYPSLSVEAYRVARQLKQVGIARTQEEDDFITPYKMAFGSKVIPLGEEGDVWIYYRKMGEDDYVSAYKTIGAFDDIDPKIKERVKGKILFIGSSAEGLKDLRATPINSFLPGVEIHANITEQIIQEAFFTRPDIVYIYENFYIMFLGGIMILITPFLSLIWVGFTFIVAVGLAFLASFKGVFEYQLLIDPVFPSISIFLIFAASTLLSYLRSETERKQVRQAFGFYISPDFMKELTKNPDRLKLGGEQKELTLLFSDIRSFTTISESLSPEALIQLMNDFLTPMSDLVMSNRGTIDKYMGDAMMAFWNAPLDDEDHARNACHAALQMNKALDPINDMLAAKAKEEGKSPLVLEAGIGLNTGPASVGNMGSKQRFAYSALGDTVNLASRLEGQTKQYGVRILIGENTRKQALEFAALELDLIQVKGKQEPERIFVLLGTDEMAQSDMFKKWQDIHNEMLAAYRAMKWDEAMSRAQTCQEISGEGMTGFYNMFMERITALKQEPPPADWGGIFVATSK